jgi:DNA-binding beta-propeller fold protein YncE
MRMHLASRIFGVVVAALLAAGAMPSAAMAAPGDQLWSATFSSGGRQRDGGHGVAVSPDGTRVFVTGVIGRNRAFMTIAYDAATGARLWQAEWYATYPTDGIPADIAVGPAGGRVYVTGVVGDGNTDDYGTVAYDAATGDRLWHRRYDGPAGGDDRAFALVPSPNGHTLFVTGESEGRGRSAATTVAYDSKSGSQEWVSRQHPGRDQNTFRDLAISPDGTRLYATGWSGNPPAFLSEALDAGTGHSLWDAMFHRHPDDFDQATAIAVAPDGGNVLVGGSSGGSSGVVEMVTIDYDPATGDARWVRTHAEGETNWLSELAIAPDGGSLAVTGSVQPRGKLDMDAVTIVYRLDTGAKLWLRRYGDPAGRYDYANVVAYAPDGSTVYVAGRGDVSEATHFFTVAYDAANGAKEWLRRSKDRGSAPFASALGISVAPDGSAVYVTGLRFRNPRRADFLTIAYEA